VLTLAMLALPESTIGPGGPGTSNEVRDTMLRILAEHYVGPVFASVAAIVFALLLLSAVNTAITDLVSIQYMMSRDKELPRKFGGLNNWGMPVLALLVGTVAPIVVVLLAPDVGTLADLYAIGVVGAVALNLGSCATNPKAELKLYERTAMGAIAVLMVLIWLTIAWEKPNALIFAMTIMGVGLAGRWTARHREQIHSWAEKRFPAVVGATSSAASTLAAKAAALTKRPATVSRAPTKTRILVCTRGNPRLLKYAIEQCRLSSGELFVLFVRHVAVPTMGLSGHADMSQDAEAVNLFASVKEQADAAGVPVYFLYSVAYDVAEAILETAATYAVDTLLLGTTQRGMLWRAMKGDVIQQVAYELPERITLLVHAG
jgi:nucleotide-binding universal stress UspA family protein